MLNRVVWATADLMVKPLFLAGHNTVILDATNTIMANRDFWRNPNWTNAYVGFDTPVEVCLQRAVYTNQGDLVPVIKGLDSKFEPINTDVEGLFPPLNSYFSPNIVTVADIRRHFEHRAANPEFLCKV